MDAGRGAREPLVPPKKRPGLPSRGARIIGWVARGHSLLNADMHRGKRDEVEQISKRHATCFLSRLRGGKISPLACGGSIEATSGPNPLKPTAFSGPVPAPASTFRF